MKKQLVIIGLVVLLVGVGLSGCSTQNNNGNHDNNTINPEKMRFIGTWKSTAEGSNSTLELYSNGTFFATIMSGVWDLKNDTFIMELPDYNKSWEYGYIFSDNNNTLALTLLDNGKTVVYAKQ